MLLVEARVVAEVLVGGEQRLDGERRGDGRDVLHLDHVPDTFIETNLVQMRRDCINKIPDDMYNRLCYNTQMFLSQYFIKFSNIVLFSLCFFL